MAKRPTAPRDKVSDGGETPQPKPKRARSNAAPPPATAAEQAPAGPPADVTEDDIRRRAYERYLARGGNHGRHFDDWLEAERELKTRK